MRYSNDKDTNDILNEAVREHRCKVSVTGSSHLKVTFPSGAVVFAARTPGDHRSQLNLRSQIKRLARQTKETS